MIDFNSDFGLGIPARNADSIFIYGIKRIRLTRIIRIKLSQS